MDGTKTFHQTTLKYLNDWTKWLNDVKVYSWIALNETLKWDHVECATLWMIGRNYFEANDMDKLFDQFALLESYLKAWA